MPWKNRTTMSLRLEFVTLANHPEANMSQLCQRFNISRPTGYKWLRRWRQQGIGGLSDRSRRPHHQPNQTPKTIEQLVIKARQDHPGWGARKLRRWLLNQINDGCLDLSCEQIPAASTITTILERNDLLAPADSPSRQGAWNHFEYPAPNQLWQMDFKGEFPLLNTQWCYPLTIIDDHSRYSVAVQACGDQRTPTVQSRLKACFQRYGMPEAILCDNGNPWGRPQRWPDGRPYYTTLGAWMIRLGIHLIYSTPGRPQGKGKNERFNGSLQAELIRFKQFKTMPEAQNAFDRWRHQYNTERPHESLNMEVPGSRYRPSLRSYPSELPPIEYDPHDQVRKVSAHGKISFKKKLFRVGKAFIGQPVAVRPHTIKNQWNIYYCHQQIRTITFK